MGKIDSTVTGQFKRRQDPLANAVDSYIRELSANPIVSSPGRSKNLAVAATLVSGLALGAVNTAAANTFTVTNNADAGAGSLRDAVAQADANPGLDTINFSGAGASGVTTLTSGEILAGTDDLEIIGPGAANLSIDGNNTDRVFSFNGDTTISGLTIQNGDTSSNGGGFRVIGGTVELRDSVVSGNHTDSKGGGIYNDNGQLKIYDSTISNNSSDQYGGGISSNYYSLRMVNSTVSGNTATKGGGISLYAEEEGPYIYIADSVISNNTATSGYGYGNSFGGEGGGIFFGGDDYVGSLVIKNTTISGNHADRHGGGVRVVATEADDDDYSGGIVRFIDSVVSSNTADANGGGISIYADDYAAGLEIRRTTISGNTATANGGGLHMGLAYESESGTMYFFGIYDSTFSGNHAKQGGGIFISKNRNTSYYNYGSSGEPFTFSGDANISNTTISGNTAKTIGGGLRMVGYGYGLNILSSTITNNTAYYAGGVSFASTTGSNFLRNTIISGNTSAGEGDPNLAAYGESLYSYYSIIESYAGSVGGNNNQFNVNPLLGPLANNGGPTQTHALQSGSPAIDAGDAALAGGPLVFDQRTTSTSQGFLRVAGAKVDIGAVEFNAPEVGAPPSASSIGPAVAIPTLSSWTLWLLSLLLPATAMAWIQRRRKEE